MAQYFTKDTDRAIAKFNETSDSATKNIIFQDEIRPAFQKLIENQIFIYGFYSVGDVDTLKDECLGNLYEMIPKFKIERGTKGFSYFNVVAKNWFIHKSREKSKKNRIEESFDGENTNSNDGWPNRNGDQRNLATPSIEDLVQEKERWVKFYDEMESWRECLDRKTEIQVLEAVLFIMKHPDLVSIYNKKAVFLYIRDLTGLNTKQVVSNLKKIKSLYEDWNEKFSSTGESLASS